jgi:hypothetical protein
LGLRAACTLLSFSLPFPISSVKELLFGLPYLSTADRERFITIQGYLVNSLLLFCELIKKTLKHTRMIQTCAQLLKRNVPVLPRIVNPAILNLKNLLIFSN